MGAAVLLTLVLLGQTANPPADPPARTAESPRARAVDDASREQRAAEFRANLQKQVEKKHAARAGKGKGRRNMDLRNPLPQVTPVANANNGAALMGGDPFQIAQQQQLGNQLQAIQLATQLQYQQAMLGAQYAAFNGGFVSGARPASTARATTAQVYVPPELRGVMNPTTSRFAGNPVIYTHGAYSVGPFSQAGPTPFAGMMQSDGAFGSMSGLLNMTNGALGLPGTFPQHAGSTHASGTIGHH